MKPLFADIVEKKAIKPPIKKGVVFSNNCENCTGDKNEFDFIGKGKEKILIIDEFVTLSESKSNKICNSSTWQQLQTIAMKEGIDIFQDCWIVKAVRCHCKSGVKDVEIKNCKFKLLETIKELNPKKIITLGNNSLKALIGHRVSSRISMTNPEKWYGEKIPDQELKTWVYPVNNPIYCLNEEKIKDNSKNIFIKHFKEAFKHDEKFIQLDLSICEFTEDVKKAINYLKYFQTVEKIAFDYETTGIKPQKEGHEIICIGISDGEINTCFPIFDNDEFKSELKKLLTGEVEKYVHNMKYEASWTKEILGYDVENWLYDSMIGTHIISNQDGITGLKFQTYVNFGVLGYDDGIDIYLNSKGSNDVNEIKQAPIKDVLQYCSMDAYFTFLLCEKQKDIIDNDKHLKKGYNLFHNGILALKDVELFGMLCDTEKLENNQIEITEKQKELETIINTSKEVEKWDGKDFNFNSGKQLGHLLFDICGYKSKKTTAGGSFSTDVESLEFINTDFTKSILQHKKLEKIKTTYLEGFSTEAINGIIHPSFNLHTVSSYRSSASNPNFQNIPKRDDNAKKYIRTCLIPRKGNMIVEVDFSGIEVRIGACYHKDGGMVGYILDETTDMHRDTAADLFMKPKDLITKQERQAAKNGFVFPQFYGDYYKNCAPNIWDQIDDSTKNHLKTKGVRNLLDFEEVCYAAERQFWEVRFTDYNQWRKDNWKAYLKNGYIDLFTGFRVTGNLTRNQANNIPIQGSAFHCLLWSLIRVNNFIKRKNLKSRIIGQIHDSLVLDAVKDEWEILRPEIKSIMTEKIRDYWSWIILPLKCEIDYYENNWGISEKSEEL